MRRKRINQNNILNNRIVVFLLTLYLVGLIFGLFIERHPIVTTPNQTNQPIKVFFNIFSMHYWYIFIIWLMGLCSIGFFIDVLITFFRGLIFGVLIASLIKNSFKYLLIMLILEGVIFLPCFIFLLYLSFSLSFGNFLNVFFNRRVFIAIDMKKYVNSMLFITTIFVIYSIILTVI